ncbi:MAG: hypothetical protein ACRESY_03975 [Steroidobacteraceae bacterium]
MATARRLFVTLMTVSVLSACASAPQQRPATAAVQTKPRYVTVTGSHLPVPVNPRTGLPESSLPIQSVSSDDMRSTGQDSSAAALRMLVPIVR